MLAEVISIGSELTSGVRLDTNTQWLADRLAGIGIEVGYHTTVADDHVANIDVFASAVRRAKLVIATGGLGPTLDDLTREVVAQVAQVPLELDPASLAHIEAIFKMFNRPMPDRNRVQAMFPQGATVIPNMNGTAPGIWLDIRGTIVVCLPGVPREMKPMFTDWVLPRVKERFGSDKVILHHTLRCFGAGESQIEEMLGDLTKRGRYPEVGITASEATISLRVTAQASSVEEARAHIAPDLAFIRAQLGELVFGENDDRLQDAVGRALIERNVTLSTAESCTGGMLGALLTEVPGISSVYLGGIVSYANQVKEEFLDVDKEILATNGAVSEECAAAMAEGCRQRFGSALAVSITGIAGPGGGTPEKPVGLVYVGLAHQGKTIVRQFKWGNDRQATRIRAAKMALNIIRVHLLREA